MKTLGGFPVRCSVPTNNGIFYFSPFRCERLPLPADVHTTSIPVLSGMILQQMLITSSSNQNVFQNIIIECESVKYRIVALLTILLRHVSASFLSIDRARMTSKDVTIVEVIKRGRGRPPKLDANGNSTVVVKVVSDRKRGRPPKIAPDAKKSPTAGYECLLRGFMALMC